MTPYPFTTAEMKAMAGVVQMVCVEENQAMIEQRKQGLLSDEKTCNELVDCWKSTYVKANDHCGEEYQNLVKCLFKNERKSLKCKELRNLLDECYVKKVMLKQSK
uniref:Uncharacterized protein n=1 Tax=Thalassionema nitzschioides TaxID=33649 RepID=A0A6T5YFV6_9STRA|mmetsp:Transcript_7479/g.10881  ORF Transcript_7479/g.10881 Transcript_7479/m.10881 type:complete len:105 (-) Transcript_7479:1180-1494(-)|eukprot:CAMPEP_0194200162 /NCGR_PEP_ID=MMETSP0156-20130528/890_1 /TAXON_ID=33649 /ORGANISM="Thalassionema nitzschioides, Strain L26-B" /LENGTH=104 /DNA_ID=CAMNT_0038925129 /DNA_START=82 /DNA_END=396 /DNA_ORIENTATION=+